MHPDQHFQHQLDALSAILVNGAPVSLQKLQASASVVQHGSEYASPAALNGAVATLAGLIPSLGLMRAGMTAVTGGALVEQGADAVPLIAPVLGRLPDALAQSAAFVAQCIALAGEDSDDVVERFGAEAATDLPESANAYRAMEWLARCAVTVLLRLPQARKAARDHAALNAALEAYPLVEGSASWLMALMKVADDEEIIVLHPALRRAYRVRMDGVSGNFQLYTLLADALMGDPAQGWLPGERPYPEVVESARTYTTSPVPATGAFNLLTWQALRSDGTLPDSTEAMAHWVWIEGSPADIPAFEGQRVILVGPAPYKRSWTMVSPFQGVTASVEVLEKLSEAAVEDWLRRLAQANLPR